ncbi:MAG TPA: bifunctional diguanylate cyclase/phosphodiesterase [Gammaproteobacteria bacterium]|nr:bifunctional diguanylate cyclase/phosphodiesterase [Gammaproteobacteria bacterium]
MTTAKLDEFPQTKAPINGVNGPLFVLFIFKQMEKSSTFIPSSSTIDLVNKAFDRSHHYHLVQVNFTTALETIKNLLPDVILGDFSDSDSLQELMIAGGMADIPVIAIGDVISNPDNFVDILSPDELSEVLLQKVVRYAYDKQRMLTVMDGIWAHKQQVTKTEPVTGLLNRQHFLSQLKNLLKKQKNTERLAVLLLKIDNLRKINGELGETRTNELLKKAARRLQQLYFKSDQLGHLGNGFFAVICPQIESRRELIELAYSAARSLRASYRFEQEKYSITVSMGACLQAKSNESAAKLLYQAENAHTTQQQKGRSGLQIFQVSPTKASLNRSQINKRLKKSLKSKRFELHYQPQYATSGHRGIISMEALVRWRSSQHGLIRADAFIPAAEDSGLITPLGIWIVNTACLQLAHWRKSGNRSINIAINLVPMQLNRQFTVNLHYVLKRYQLPANCLELEISESRFSELTPEALEQLQILRKSGVRIAADNFGTGGTSIPELSHLPIDILKIDRRLTADINQNMNETLTSSTIAIAKHLGMTVVAEGIESKEQAKMLSRQKCERLQGFYFSQVLPASDFKHLLED